MNMTAAAATNTTTEVQGVRKRAAKYVQHSIGY